MSPGAAKKAPQPHRHWLLLVAQEERELTLVVRAAQAQLLLPVK